MPSDKDINRQTTAGKQCIHGGGSTKNAGNRWYDKTVQVDIITTQNINCFFFIYLISYSL